MDEQDSRPTPQEANKKKKGKIIGTGARLEGFLDWVDLNASNLAEEREDDMFSMTAEFVARKRKRATNAQGETTLGSEVYGEKRPKWLDPDEEAQKSMAVITVDSIEQAPNALLTLEGVFQDASREACVSLEDGVPARGGGGGGGGEFKGRLYQI